jgi:hypothetical protein
MVDINDGCGSGHGGGYVNSFWAIGLALDTTASELSSPFTNPLANFANTKYANLTQTVLKLFSSGNISQSAALLLTNTIPNAPPGTPPGCIDQSFAIFTNAAANESGALQAQDFQDAADLLTNADGFTNTTCDSVVTNNLSGFTEPNPQTNPPVLNPSGQIRARLANLYYTINTLLISTLGINATPGNSVASTWPAPVSISVSPQSFTQGHEPVVTLSWALNYNTQNQTCTWSSNDPNFTAPDPIATNPPQVTVSPPQLTTGTFNYALKCTVPAGSVPAPGSSMTATTYLTVKPPPPPTLTSLNPPAVCDDPVKDNDNNGTCQYQSTISWTNATGCTLTDNGLGSLLMGGLPLPAPLPANGSAVYSAVEGDGAKSVTFTLACPNLSPIQRTLSVSD